MTTNAGDLPRILIVDDQFGTNNEVRTQVLDRLALHDSSSSIDPSRGYLATADVCTALSKGQFSESALKKELESWGDFKKWDLVLVDNHFYSEREEKDEVGAQRIVEFLRSNGCADENAFILFTRSEVGEQTLKNSLCKEYLRKPTGNLPGEEIIERRRKFGRLLFENGFITDGPVRYVDHAGHIVHKGDRASFFGSTPETRKLLRLARRALTKWSKTHSPILIEGRSGSGKIELARYLHRWSEAAFAYAADFVDLSGRPQEREFRVISSGELGAAFLSALLLQGEFTTLNDLWERIWRDTIVLREITSFDPETLMGLARHAMGSPRSRSRLHVFTTCQSTISLVDGRHIPHEFLSQISSVLRIPRIGLRADWEAIFLWELDNLRPQITPIDRNTLSQVAQEYLDDKAHRNKLTFGRLKAMARLEAEWQAGHQDIKNFRVVGVDRLRDWYSQTEGIVRPEEGLGLTLQRLERYELSPSDEVTNGLTHLQNAMRNLFIQMVATAYSTCSEDRNETGRYLGGDIPSAKAGYSSLDYLKRWFTFLGVENDPLYKKIAGESQRGRASKRKK